MKHRLLLFFIAAPLLFFGQSKIERFYQTKKYKEIIAYEKEGHNLSGKDLYRVGQSYLILKDDTSAIRMFEKSIKKGNKTGDVYYNLGIAYNNIEFFREAAQSCKTALMYVPYRKPYMMELAAALYQMSDLDSALATYKQVKKHYPENQLSTFMICQLLHEQEKYKQCLECYYNSRRHYKGNNKYYQETYENIARIEWHYYKHADKAEKALQVLRDVYPEHAQYKLWTIQFLNEHERYDEADKMIITFESMYMQRKLPGSFYKKGAFLMEEIPTESYNLEIYKNFQPKKNNGVNYKCFVFSKDAHRLTNQLFVKVEGDSLSITSPVLSGISATYPAENGEIRYKDVKFYTKDFVLNPPLPQAQDTILTNQE